jgi:hypothetical protein
LVETCDPTGSQCAARGGTPRDGSSAVGVTSGCTATPAERRDLLRRWNEEDEARAKQPPCPKREDFDRDTEYFLAYKDWNDERNHLRAVDGEAAAEAAG